MPEMQMPEHMIAEAARRFGVTEDEIRAQWAELNDMAATGGEEAVKAQLVSLLLETERDISEMVDSAREYVVSSSDRMEGMMAFYRDVVMDTQGTDLDYERILQFFILAAWKLAEAQEREAALLDGGHRKGGG